MPVASSRVAVGPADHADTREAEPFDDLRERLDERCPAFDRAQVTRQLDPAPPDREQLAGARKGELVSQVRRAPPPVRWRDRRGRRSRPMRARRCGRLEPVPGAPAARSRPRSRRRARLARRSRSRIALSAGPSRRIDPREPDVLGAGAERQRLGEPFEPAVVGRAPSSPPRRRPAKPSHSSAVPSSATSRRRDLVLEQHVGVDDVAAPLDHLARAPERVDVLGLGKARVEAMLGHELPEREQGLGPISGDRDHLARHRPSAGLRSARSAIEMPSTSIIAFGPVVR